MWISFVVHLGRARYYRRFDDGGKPIWQRIKNPFNDSRVACASLGVRWRWNGDVCEIDVVGDVVQLSAPGRVVNEQLVRMAKAFFDGPADHPRSNDSDLHRMERRVRWLC